MGITRDRCLETSTTTGTGALALAGAVTGYRSFSTGVVDLNKYFDYAIEAIDGSGVPTGEWEVGEGYLSGATTLVRDVVLASSNANALVSFSAGTKRVFLTFSGNEMQDKGMQQARSMYLQMA